MSDPKDEPPAKLESGDNDYSLNVHGGSIGPSVIDVSGLYGSSGQFTYDPGFTSTASCKSSITYIDGEEGILLHRGYPIEQLAEKGELMVYQHPGYWQCMDTVRDKATLEDLWMNDKAPWKG